jgi:hypothetical protein
MAKKLETISFYLPEDLAYAMWNHCAAERITIDQFVERVLTKAAKRADKIIKLPARAHHRARSKVRTPRRRDVLTDCT